MKSKHIFFSLILAAGITFSISACTNSELIQKSQSPLIMENFILTATGQTACFDNDGNTITAPNEEEALYGQDGNFRDGAKMSYSNHGDGIIIDNNTGLMWEEIPSSEGFSWEDAKEYCKKLNLGAYSDWRLPTAKELYSISDFGRSWPYLDTTYFKLATGHVDKSEQFWTSHLYVGSTAEGQENAAFGVNHVTGHIKAYPSGKGMDKNNMPPQNENNGNHPGGNGPQGTPPPGRSMSQNSQNGTMPPPPGGQNSKRPSGNPMLKHVRAVRGSQYAVNAFADNSNGTVSDTASGLMWAQDDSGEGLNWEEALIFAKNSKLAGYSDWRLPNVKELQSIVDYSFAPGASDANNEGPAIDPIFSCTPIVNEAGNSDYAYYWTSTSAQFTAGEPYYYAWYVAFGRAVNQEGVDFHGAGAVRFDTKYEGGALGEGGERYANYVRLVRDIR